MTRRDFLAQSSAAAALPFAASLASAAAPALAPGRKFTLNLIPSFIGVRAATQADVNALAARHGFESVEARAGEIAQMSPDGLKQLADDLNAKKLVWGAAGLPNGARADSPTFAQDVKALPALAAGLKRAGVTRIGTWISPASETQTYNQNFRQHVARYTEVARILDSEGLRLGLEYVGTATLRRKPRHPFIHSMAESRELFAEIPVKNVGFVLDSWHWHTAGEGEAEILSCKPAEVVAVDLNDAPAGIDRLELIDNQRELPATTGVIDAGVFLSALVTIGYDGPVRAEPFNAALNAMEDDPACAATAAAMRRALERIRT